MIYNLQNYFKAYKIQPSISMLKKPMLKIDPYRADK